MNLIIKSDCDHVAGGASAIVAETVRSNPRAALCLPAGKTPLGMYKELIRLHRSGRLDFSRVQMFHLDEYVGLRPDHPGRFESYFWREFFNHINVRRSNIHFIDENYEKTIRDVGGIDLLILGIGANGHLAFNEPGSAPDSRTRNVQLAASTIERMRQTFKPAELPQEAITIGLATIMEARRILLIACGSEKASVLAEALTGPVRRDIPASILQSHNDVAVIADESAFHLCPPV
jgi:glucosamine-6-phosphate deaminase